MRVAIEEAVKARDAGDYAIGAVVVKDGEVIARSPNLTKGEQDPIQHAEIVVIRSACKKLKSRYLEGCVLYTTHEPCPVCAAACVWAKLKGVVFGATVEDMADYSIKNGNSDWKWRVIKISAAEILNKAFDKQGRKQTTELVEEFMREECRSLFHS